MLFKDLKLIDPILKALSEEGYTTPTPIQAQSIPLVLERKDLLGCAQTGTGKTAAFSIPILQILSEKKSTERKRPIRCLIVTPTRELAIQIGESLQAYGKYTGLTSTVIFGGVNQSRQVAALHNGVDILVATPGRLIDLMNQRYISLSNIEIFVLDEADRMLDMGFIHDVKRLLVSLPPRRQSLFFSATMPPEILRLASTILHDPSKVEVTPVSSTAETIKQFMYFIDRGNKNSLLVDVLKDPKIKTCLVFTRTKHVADKVVKMLAEHKIKAEAIHGNKSQNARQNALTNFKAQTTRILVATDIAARGIDVDNLEYVINYEIPNVPETYVHRIGRTGRAGANGTAFSFCDAEEKAYLKDIEKLISIKIPVIDDHAYPLMDHNPPKTVQGGRQQRSSSPRPSSNAAGSGRSGGSSNKPAGSGSRRPSSGGGSSSSSSRSRNDGPPKKRW
jgi:ATP-dependent RNA helicase RhlE